MSYDSNRLSHYLTATLDGDALRAQKFATALKYPSAAHDDAAIRKTRSPMTPPANGFPPKPLQAQTHRLKVQPVKTALR